ncbi:PAS domain-containing protein [Sphingomonas sp. KRR8]|uniref:sensor histidine kinase n=1 Tax=Sphingomonas sp. KRR8 TaxID=2942996 RepID=UPI0020207AE7|nr:PAS domain-containing protein [Sphingomonas sp. KRR8]URD60678.1 PAS domain-containing protein [Sphingomonas sp. KRR8]
MGREARRHGWRRPGLRPERRRLLRPRPSHDQEPVKKALQQALAGTRDYDIEFRMVRPDGSHRWTHTRGVVVRESTGKPLRMVGVDEDITDHKARETALRENDRFLQSVLDASTDCIKVIELDGTVSFMNRNGQRVMEVADVTRLLGKPWEQFWPEPGAAHVRDALVRAARGEHSTFEAFCPTAAGTPKWWDVSVSPILDENGAPSRIVSISRDITARRYADDQLKLFNAELHHRIKNNLATIQAMARATLRNAPDAATFEKNFSERLMALASTYGLLRTDNDAASLTDLVRNELRPYEMGSQEIRITGPDVVLPAKSAITVGMVLHELTTNACKYGSLHVEGGALEVCWTLDENHTPAQVHLTWTERNSPCSGAPIRSGFGSTLIDRLVRQHRGTLERDWQSDGLSLRLTLPLA